MKQVLKDLWEAFKYYMNEILRDENILDERDYPWDS